jgi:predicted DsbA family dithiol-disulfide isomerase
MAQAESLGIRSTPVFLFGRRDDSGRVTVKKIVVGARPISEFRDAVEAVLHGA